ncbi:hypothetical protein EIP91_004715 [Steccherinum ochraceum]|uniref:Zn(2)-C6 fungal-type domain-containing protein n=1 Tax=Steccherinum ochraceum TaxID=92696 RepID=A0A4R0R918_9APHY|nr:hypothetical protein EIP91_004715 [Steccherinum ochraceum]
MYIHFDNIGQRRRNRTMHSCLNCHNSKRKCDRKRPCQRCIELGLTGLCVYQVDDPTAMDDPNLDQNMRLRRRIAELESLVRDLRGGAGKPHPRWMKPNSEDTGGPERWHSRSKKSPQFDNQRYAIDDIHITEKDMASPTDKLEQSTGVPQRRLYHPSTSPPLMMGYSPPTLNSHRGSQSGTSSNAEPNNGLHYQQSYVRSLDPTQDPLSCSCVMNLVPGHPLFGLDRQLQATMHLLHSLHGPSDGHYHSGSVDAIESDSNNSDADCASTPTKTVHMSSISTSSYSMNIPASSSEWSNMGSTATMSTSHYDTYSLMNWTADDVYEKTYRDLA